MKTTQIIAFLIALTPFSAYSNSTYIDDVKNFGYVSGEGLACGASRYPTYELIVRAYLVSAAKSDDEQAKGMYEYNAAKAKAYMGIRSLNYSGCSEINERFNNQKIFNSKLYKNGTLKLPDGKIIKPRKKYNPNYLSDRNKDERTSLNEYYDKVLEKKQKSAKKQGIYQKILKEENRKR